MCRLYGFHATEPTRLECSLVRAQNALIAQSIKDREGLTHGHGWGVAEHPNGVPFVEKQAWAAYDGEHFQKTAARLYSRMAIAHVRRATVGPPGLENTHPFVHGVWLFAHNGRRAGCLGVMMDVRLTTYFTTHEPVPFQKPERPIEPRTDQSFTIGP